jgi:hypothetical protein
MQDFLQRLCDLLCHALLHLQAPGVHLQQARHLGQSEKGNLRFVQQFNCWTNEVEILALFAPWR